MNRFNEQNVYCDVTTPKIVVSILADMQMYELTSISIKMKVMP